MEIAKNEKEFKQFDAKRFETTPQTVGISIAQRLQNARNAKKWTQKETAQRLNMLLGDYQKLEQGTTSKPTTKHCKAIVNLLNVH
jgi:ribosome-binding protein aMBF1 (putative translation factor)